MPDGLWLKFGGTPADPFVDIFAIEACSSLQNLLDKRSKIRAKRAISACSLSGALAARAYPARRPNAALAGARVICFEPAVPFVVVVCDLRAMYGLKRPHYDGFMQHHCHTRTSSSFRWTA